MAATIDEQSVLYTAKMLDDKLKRLLRTGLVANMFLLAGGSMFVAFFARQMGLVWWARDTIGDILYFVGFAANFMSGFSELWIDSCWIRTFGHGRYTTKKRTNMLITILFLLGNIGDSIAFVFWRQGQEGLHREQMTLWVSTHILLLTAVLVLVTNRPKYVPFQNRLDSVANFFFFCQVMLSCCALYVATGGRTSRNQIEMRLELSSAVFWMASALFYILADGVRLKDPDSIIYS